MLVCARPLFADDAQRRAAGRREGAATRHHGTASRRLWLWLIGKGAGQGGNAQGEDRLFWQTQEVVRAPAPSLLFRQTWLLVPRPLFKLKLSCPSHLTPYRGSKPKPSLKLKSTKCRVYVLQLRGGGCSGSKGAAAADVQIIVPSSEDAAGKKAAAEAHAISETKAAEEAQMAQAVQETAAALRVEEVVQEVGKEIAAQNMAAEKEAEKATAEANVAEETVEEEAAKAKTVETEELEELVVPAGGERQHHPYCLLPRRALSCPL